MPPPNRRERRWVFAPTDAASAAGLAAQCCISPLVAQLLLNRDIRTPDAAKGFLRPELNHLHDPELLPGISEAASRIQRALDQGERIVIYGDYDVDGICATAILLECIELAGGSADYYLPDRQAEGYGLNADAIRRIAGDGADLLVTVDCGVTALEEAVVAREAGLDLIVTDHHEPGEQRPDALAVIDPHFPDSSYPFRHLSGAGVAFKLAWAVGKHLSPTEKVTPEFRSFLMDAVALACLGTIADVVPLGGENRVLACYGLEALRRSTRPGIRSLCRVASVLDGPLGAWDVAFKLAPRLNAAGRLGSARRGVDLLMTRDEGEAARMAQDLDRENARRQRIQERTLEEAFLAIEEQGGAEGKLGLVLASDHWHPGVVGVVAGRLADRLSRPVIAIALDGDAGQGSARSGGAVNLYETLCSCSDLLVGFGGHEHAAGLRVQADKIDALRERFEASLRQCVGEADLISTVEIEMQVRLPSLSMELLREIEKLAPFGEGNRSPVFASTGLKIVGTPRRIGSGGKHLSFWVNQDGVGLRALAFNMGDLASELTRKGVCSLAYVPKINTFRGRRSIEIEVKDAKLTHTI